LHVFQHVTCGAVLHGLEEVVAVVESGDDYDACLRQLRFDELGSLETVADGHLDIHEHDVRLEIAGHAHEGVEKKIIEYVSEYDEEPTDEYLAGELEEEVAKVQKARHAGDVYHLMPIDDQMQIFGSENTYDDVEQDELVEIVQDILGDMPEREQML